ncbi:hypothetical protein CCACVL1_04365 [Corchorus capsularis]|uniref:Uncharacterized protein n=1 Tax=Corchorus capsularis TaxID=210143 RepID=A0A1R3JTA4_COCAP|nr:hypothetical protein CCACVL1_04365 [Corchorus capsularis]
MNPATSGYREPPPSHSLHLCLIRLTTAASKFIVVVDIIEHLDVTVPTPTPTG